MKQSLIFDVYLEKRILVNTVIGFLEQKTAAELVLLFAVAHVRQSSKQFG